MQWRRLGSWTRRTSEGGLVEWSCEVIHATLGAILPEVHMNVVFRLPG